MCLLESAAAGLPGPRAVNETTSPSGRPAAVLFGLEGCELSSWERGFFREADPTGFILFHRNVRDPEQLLRLTSELREAVGREEAPILVDQEGGRVQRLRPPHWPSLPAMGVYGELAARDLAAALRGAWLQARLIADDLLTVGIDVDCLPCIDLQVPGAHAVIGDRSFGSDPEIVSQLGKAVCEGLLAGGVAPVLKHIPGHGRATHDSHLSLPHIDADLASLASDFFPFRQLSDQGWAMTAHVVLTAIDPHHPATQSSKVISEIIRHDIGFGGVLVSDDINMQALRGPIAERAAASLAAGCDLVLHCSGRREEMEEVASVVQPLSSTGLERLQRATPPAPGKFDRAAALDELQSLVGAIS